MRVCRKIVIKKIKWTMNKKLTTDIKATVEIIVTIADLGEVDEQEAGITSQIVVLEVEEAIHRINMAILRSVLYVDQLFIGQDLAQTPIEIVNQKAHIMK